MSNKMDWVNQVEMPGKAVYVSYDALERYESY